MGALTIMSWNVNGMRAAIRNGFMRALEQLNPDIIGLQEIKAERGQVGLAYSMLEENYNVYWNMGKRKGYSGVALLSKQKPKKVSYGIGIDEFDKEGRIIEADYSKFVLLNVYFPNGKISDERLDYKLRFYDKMLNHIIRIRDSGRHVIVMGDFNTAHREIDLKNPKANEKYSGFLPIERKWIDRYIDAGFVDTFREMHPHQIKYSWWSYRFNARKRNIGWRIDYVFVDKGFMKHIEESFILTDIMGSDHCPVGIKIKV